MKLKRHLLTAALTLFCLHRIRVGTIQTAERTALQENDEPETRPVECSHTVVGVYVYHITFFRGNYG